MVCCRDQVSRTDLVEPVRFTCELIVYLDDVDFIETTNSCSPLRKTFFFPPIRRIRGYTWVHSQIAESFYWLFVFLSYLLSFFL